MMTVDERLALANRIPADATTIATIAAAAGLYPHYATDVALGIQVLSLISAAERHDAVVDLLKVVEWVEDKGCVE